MNRTALVCVVMISVALVATAWLMSRNRYELHSSGAEGMAFKIDRRSGHVSLVSCSGRVEEDVSPNDSEVNVSLPMEAKAIALAKTARCMSEKQLISNEGVILGHMRAAHGKTRILGWRAKEVMPGVYQVGFVYEQWTAPLGPLSIKETIAYWFDVQPAFDVVRRLYIDADAATVETGLSVQSAYDRELNDLVGISQWTWPKIRSTREFEGLSDSDRLATAKAYWTRHVGESGKEYSSMSEEQQQKVRRRFATVVGKSLQKRLTEEEAMRQLFATAPTSASLVDLPPDEKLIRWLELEKE